MRKIPCVLASLALSTTLAAPCLASTFDYSFLDGMSVDELQDLQDEVGNRLSAARDNLEPGDSDDLGSWVIDCYVDEFDRDTDEQYIRGRFDGKFSNSATSGSECDFLFFIDYYGDLPVLEVRLIEYGRHVVHASYDDDHYSILMADKNDVRTTLEGVMIEGDRDIVLIGDDAQAIIDALLDGGPVSFAITEDQDYGVVSKYILTIDDPSGLDNALKKLGVERFRESSTPVQVEEANGTDNEVAGTLADGTYEAEGKGIGGAVPVAIVIKDGKISEVTIGDNFETTGIGSKAVEQLPALIVDAGGTADVDGVSGATITSEAIFTAVDDCIAQAQL